MVAFVRIMEVSSRMKILMLSNLISYTYNFRKEIIEAFARCGHEVVVVCDIDDASKCRELSEISKVIDVPFHGKGTNPREELKLVRTYSTIMKRENPDIVFSFTIKMNLYGGLVAKRLRIPYVPMITGLGELEKGGKLKSILMFLHKRVMPGAKCVVFQNEDNRDYFKRNGIGFKESVIVPGSGINLGKFVMKPYPPRDKVVFSFLGRFIEAKGILEFLQCAERMACDEISFIAAGAMDEKFKRYVDELVSNGKLVYEGELGDTRDFLEKTSCLVLPTYHPEGLSNVILEACATGRPVICTPRTGCKEIVEDGVNGFFCNAKDVENLMEIMKRFRSLPYEERKRMGEAGRRIVEGKFDRNLVVGQYLSLLE